MSTAKSQVYGVPLSSERIEAAKTAIQNGEEPQNVTGREKSMLESEIERGSGRKE